MVKLEQSVALHRQGERQVSFPPLEGSLKRIPIIESRQFSFLGTPTILFAISVNTDVHKGLATKRMRVAFPLVDQINNSFGYDVFY